MDTIITIVEWTSIIILWATILAVNLIGLLTIFVLVKNWADMKMVVQRVYVENGGWPPKWAAKKGE